MNDKISDKIRKLLRLSESSNVEEAANAAAAAQRLMEKHNIERAMLLGDHESWAPKLHFDAPLVTCKRVSPWHISLAQDVAMVNGCAVFVHEEQLDGNLISASICLVGTTEDVANAQHIFNFLRTEIDRLAAQYGRARRERRQKNNRTALNSFRIGAVSTIHWRLLETLEAARKSARKSAKGSVALVRIDNAIAQLDRRIDAAKALLDSAANGTPAGRASSKIDWGAYAMGQKAAKNIDLQTQKNIDLQTQKRLTTESY